MEHQIGLEDQNGLSVSLKSLHMQGKLEGLLLTMKIRQRYQNDRPDHIEVTYTFPGGWGSHVLGLKVDIAGKTLQSMALAKKQAVAAYEKAIAEGDAPAMLEQGPHGLYTANIGNLKAGEVVELELEYAQHLKFEQGRVRITIPTVIGQRYGDAIQAGGMQMHQSIEVSTLVEYPFTAVLDLVGPIAQGDVSCPTWDVELTNTEFGKRISLNSGAYLDRDFVVLLENLMGTSFASVSRDDEQYVVLASFCPKLMDSKSHSLALKVLVDCSGSMQGESIHQAQEAMHELSLSLNDQDSMSYSRFGDRVKHSSKTMEMCNSRYLRTILAPAIQDTHADMGGTELADALISTFNIKPCKEKALGCDLLLITDGDVWNIDDIVDKAHKSGHRIFAIGVGSAPAESLLRQLAEQTGGACELVTPEERISDAVLRMLQRMRSTKTQSVRIDWGGPVSWESRLPTQVFSDETIHVVSYQYSQPESLPTLHWTEGKLEGQVSPTVYTQKADDVLVRVAAATRISTMEDHEVATEWALKYQLVSKYTHLLLIHKREEDEKTQGLPTLERINQMHAAGWGGYGTTYDNDTVLACYSMSSWQSSSAPSVYRSKKSSVLYSLKAGGVDDVEVPAFLRKQADVQPARKKPMNPIRLLERFNELSIQHSKFFEIVSELMNEISKKSVDNIWNVIRELVGNQPDPIDLWAGWACLLDWLSIELANTVALNRHAQRVLQFELQKVDPVMRQKTSISFNLDQEQGVPKIKKRLQYVD